ncbi:MAG TPA: Gfo/Idh/MocA family oxidoreductase, partial [Clostridia bacterium]|nr:Gfo/Idh/MocA family oxidoreductase [Clostridia bacterium]
MIESSKLDSCSRILRFGMVGGGEGSFIGDVHRKAAKFDGKCELVAGCFSRDYDNTLRTGESLGLSKDRLYKTYEEMAAAEEKRPDGIDFAIIVTPNNAHFGAAKA